MQLLRLANLSNDRKKWLTVVAASMLLIHTATVRGQVAEPVQEPMKVIYKEVDSTQLMLHVFYPGNYDPCRQYPALILFFGGGWNGGSVGQLAPQARHFASKGMLVFTADYRVKSRHQTTPWESVKDARSAIRWLREHSGKFGIDTTRLAAGGASAGGHLAAAADLTLIDEATDKLQYSARPNALVLFNPVSNNGPGGYGYERFGDRYVEISPYHNLREGAAPAVIFLGTADKLIPVQQMKDYQARMRELGSRCELYLYEDQGHGFFNYKKEGSIYYDSTVNAATRFLQSLGYIR